jgi:proteasome beta subunit
MDSLKIRNNLKMNYLEMAPTQDGKFTTSIQEKPILVKTGTTTVGIKIKNGVCLATDNRATMGSFIASKKAKKLHRILDYVYMTIAGGVADAQYLIELLQAETSIYNLQNEHQIGVGQTAKLLQNILYGNKGYYEVGHILGGYTEWEGPKIYDIEGYGSSLEADFTAIGSGSLYAIGILESEWKPDLSLEDGMMLCVKAVRSALLRDIASGNGIDVVGIQKDKKIEKSYTVNDADVIANNYAALKAKLNK